MFATDQKAIQQYAQQSALNTAHVVEFVLTSIRRHFHLVKPIMLGEKSVKMLTMLQKGVDWAYENRDKVYAACYTEGLTDSERLMLLLAIPGIGLPKAGFILQLCTGKVGCLDVHNLRRFKLEAKDFSTSGKSVKKISEITELYVRTCQRVGDSEYLWNSWCELIANKYPKVWRDAEHVSREHAESLGL